MIFIESRPVDRPNADRLERRTLVPKEKRMSFLAATNVVASRPPERRPTGTSHARAKNPVLETL